MMLEYINDLHLIPGKPYTPYSAYVVLHRKYYLQFSFCRNLEQRRGHWHGDKAESHVGEENTLYKSLVILMKRKYIYR